MRSSIRDPEPTAPCSTRISEPSNPARTTPRSTPRARRPAPRRWGRRGDMTPGLLAALLGGVAWAGCVDPSLGAWSDSETEWVEVVEGDAAVAEGDAAAVASDLCAEAPPPETFQCEEHPAFADRHQLPEIWEPCESNLDCVGGFCIEFQSVMVCTSGCFTDSDCWCGFECRPLERVFSDPVNPCNFQCVPAR